MPSMPTCVRHRPSLYVREAGVLHVVRFDSFSPTPAPSTVQPKAVGHKRTAFAVSQSSTCVAPSLVNESVEFVTL